MAKPLSNREVLSTMTDGWEKEFAKLQAKHGNSDKFWKIHEECLALVSEFNQRFPAKMPQARKIVQAILKAYDTEGKHYRVAGSNRKSHLTVTFVDAEEQVFVKGSPEDVVYVLGLLVPA